MAKVTDAQMTEILHRYVAGEEPEALGAEFGISSTNIREATRREGWKHVALDITDEMLEKARWRQELRRRARSGLPAKLSDWAREEVRRHRQLGSMTIREVADLYSISPTVVGRICPGVKGKPGPKPRK